MRLTFLYKLPFAETFKWFMNYLNEVLKLKKRIVLEALHLFVVNMIFKQKICLLTNLTFKASENGQVEVVKELLVKGAFIEAKDKYGSNSLIFGKNHISS